MLSLPLEDKVGEPLEAASDESDSSLLELADADSILEIAVVAAALDKVSVAVKDAELSSGDEEDSELEGRPGGAVSDEAASEDAASDVAASDVAAPDVAPSEETAPDEMAAAVDEADTCSGIEAILTLSDELVGSTTGDTPIILESVDTSLGTDTMAALVEAETSGAAVDRTSDSEEEATRAVLPGTLEASEDSSPGHWDTSWCQQRHSSEETSMY